MGSRSVREARFRGFGALCAMIATAAVLLAGASFPASSVASDRGKTAGDRGKTAGKAASSTRCWRAAWKKAGAKPAKLASDEEYLRRVYLDLLGRIPSVQEAKAFLHTKESDRREKLVEYLLNHEDYPKNFGTQWTILLIGRGNQGRMVDRAALASWLRKQFAANRPWNEVVYDLVTATGSNKENGAVNYVLAHLESDAVPLTSRTTRLFLGQQIQCTQCHDHPSNEWKQARFLEHQRLLQGHEDRAENRGQRHGAGGLRPHRAPRRADRGVRPLRQAQRDGRHRLSQVP